MHALTGTWTSTRNTARTFKVWPSGALGVFQNGEFQFETTISARTTAAQIEDLAAANIRQPRGIRFESVTCNRCDGEGKSLAWGLNDNTCYKCGGRKVTTTEAGQEAKNLYTALLSTTLEHIEIGETFSYPGETKVQTKTEAHAQTPGTKVLKAGIEAQVQAMRFVAQHYAGATLVY